MRAELGCVAGGKAVDTADGRASSVATPAVATFSSNLKTISDSELHTQLGLMEAKLGFPTNNPVIDAWWRELEDGSPIALLIRVRVAQDLISRGTTIAQLYDTHLAYPGSSLHTLCSLSQEK